MFAGGHEDLDWTMSNLFDAMGAMSSKFNDRPAVASRAYDINRDGFVIAGGGGIPPPIEIEGCLRSLPVTVCPQRWHSLIWIDRPQPNLKFVGKNRALLSRRRRRGLC